MKINPVVSKEEKKYSWWPSKVVEVEERETMMSKKHYEELARIIRQRQVPYAVVRDLIAMCEEDNPRFDRERFMEACEWGTDGEKKNG